MENLPAITTQLSPEKIAAWGKVGLHKQVLSDTQDLIGLELQKILLEAEDSILGLEAATAAYRKKYTEMVTLGQNFRKLIDEKVLQQSLTKEKEYSTGTKTIEPYEAYKKATDRLLVLKIDQDRKNSAVTLKTQEIANYTAHVKNQLTQLVSDFKQRALQEIFKMYKFYLDQKVSNPDTETIKKVIREMKYTTPQKFMRSHVTDDEAKAINAGIPRPDLKALIEEMVEQVDQKFLTYHNDLKNNQPQNIDLFHQEEVTALKQETEIAVGINNLTAAAVGQAASVMTEGKALKKTWDVVIEETEAWMINVMTAFLKYPLARQNIRTKQFSNISVKQMAAALGAYATETNGKEKAPGLNYVEKVK